MKEQIRLLPHLSALWKMDLTILFLLNPSDLARIAYQKITF